MIIEIKEGNRQFTVSAELLFGLRKEDAMTQTLRQYLESLNPNAPVPHQITIGDVLAIYEKLDAMTTAEQEQQATEAAEIVDWLGEALDIAEQVGQEQRKFAADMAQSFPQYERTEEEALELVRKTYGANADVSSDWLKRHL